MEQKDSAFMAWLDAKFAETVLSLLILLTIFLTSILQFEFKTVSSLQNLILIDYTVLFLCTLFIQETLESSKRVRQFCAFYTDALVVLCIFLMYLTFKNNAFDTVHILNVSLCVFCIILGRYNMKYSRYMHNKLLRNEQTVFTDPNTLFIGEKWTGHLPQYVHNYTEPRYVYANGKESIFLQKNNGNIVGYRISPTLVIHNKVFANACTRDKITPLFIEKYGGSLLTKKDVAVLHKNWQRISLMRVAAGDDALPESCFWSYGDNLIESTHWNDDRYEQNAEVSGIILKR